MKFFYHYTDEKYLEKIKQTGIYPNHPYFTDSEYFSANEAGQALGVMPHNINCVLKFINDGRYKQMENVLQTNRFIGGGKQYLHPMRPKPISIRPVTSRIWKDL